MINVNKLQCVLLIINFDNSSIELALLESQYNSTLVALTYTLHVTPIAYIT